VTQHTNTAQELREALHHNQVQVQFRKADGSLRVMRATLRAEDLPVRTDPVDPSAPDHNLFKVWDLDKQAWRSFRTDRLESWSLTP
jgi:hypothetical protein